MDHNINRAAVDTILRNINQMIGQGQYSVADVTIALAEYTGRTIVSLCDTPISGVQMAQVIEEHIKRTLNAGYVAKGYNMGSGN